MMKTLITLHKIQLVFLPQIRLNLNIEFLRYKSSTITQGYFMVENVLSDDQYRGFIPSFCQLFRKKCKTTFLPKAERW